MLLDLSTGEGDLLEVIMLALICALETEGAKLYSLQLKVLCALYEEKTCLYVILVLLIVDVFSCLNYQPRDAFESWKPFLAPGSQLT